MCSGQHARIKMFEHQDPVLKTTGHRISFSIMDILDPHKFTRKKLDGVSTANNEAPFRSTEFGNMSCLVSGRETPSQTESLIISNNPGKSMCSSLLFDALFKFRLLNCVQLG